MKNKKLLAGIIFIVIIGMVLLGTVVIILLVSRMGESTTTLEKLAYDQTGKKYRVYIKEDDEYVPYLVLTSDYDGNVLLLREYLLPEEMQYKPSKHPAPEGSVISGGWTHYEYGSYYEESSIDEFLNTEFLERFSPAMQAAIMDTAIEVTDKKSYDADSWAEVTHTIERKVFLLSAVELGVEFSVGICITEEGTPLKYFSGRGSSFQKAYKENGKAWPYWTRTPWIYETCMVTVIGVDYDILSMPADGHIGVRPAFCLGKNTIVRKENGIFARKNAYFMEWEEE